MTSEVDRKEINELQRRFLEINLKRKELLLQHIDEREDNYIDLLPLLFHINHPTLPGYVGSDVPSGLANYQPSKQIIQLAKKYARSLDYQPKAARRIDIYGIYLMGSAGSVAHTSHSDLDVWVCINPELTDADIELLQQKRDKIQSWAAKNNIDTSIYLVRETSIIDASAEQEKETIQPGLLLDEFYRTQIYLAGRYLLWWILPKGSEQCHNDYANRLFEERHIAAEDWIDFGPVPKVTIEEYLSNALWYINKALDSPYKTALKLVLMENYLSQYPDIRPLCYDYKLFVHNLLNNATVIDSYLLMHRKVEEYLILNDQIDRLEFIRRCLYHKINSRNARHVSAGVSTKKIVDELVQEWHWNDDKRALFDKKSSWDINQIGNEKRLYIKQLITSFRTIGSFIKNNTEFFDRYKNQLIRLSRKISAHLELTQGKIERVNINFVPYMMDKHLSLVRQTKGKDLELWSFYDRAISQQEASSAEPVYQCNSLLELLVWAKVNGLLNEGTSVQYKDSIQQLQYDELERLIQVLLNREFESVPDNDEVYDHQPVIPEINVFANIGHDKLTSVAKQGVHIITQQNDPFCYGPNCYNLMETVDIYYFNNWGEQFVIHYNGDEALAESLVALLELIQRQKSQPDLQYFSFSSMRSENIMSRIKHLLNHLLITFTPNNLDTIKFVIRLATSYRVIERTDSQYIIHKAADEQSLARLMINCSDEPQTLDFDSRCFSDPVARTAMQKYQNGSNLLLFYPKDGHAVSYCYVDRTGGVVYDSFNGHQLDFSVGSLVEFLAASDESLSVKDIDIFQMNDDHSVQPYHYDVDRFNDDQDSLNITPLFMSLTSRASERILTVSDQRHSFKMNIDDNDVAVTFKQWVDRALNKLPDDTTIKRLIIEDVKTSLKSAELLLERINLYKKLYD
ncbi:MAG: class I adenylate cyclase [Kangiellaceae bacterium]|jgi:adenylate cyclase class 1|nr:class I adenylate cyclase [Kangiellaceae bacterium]